MKDWLDAYLAKRKSIYIQDSSICISFYNEERERKNEYNGRQLLELLQNAEDAATRELSGVSIRLSENEFVFANNGKPFSTKGIESLMTPNVSAKLKDTTTIGSKGLGFRSLLSWATSIQVISTDLTIEFSRESAIAFLSQIYDEHPEVKEQHESTTLDEFPIATLAAPRWIEPNANLYKDYTTYVVVRFNGSSIYSSILEQLKKIEAGELIFLNKLQHINIDTIDFKRTIAKSSKGASNLIVKTTNNGKFSGETDYIIFEKTGDIPEQLRANNSSPRRYEFKIALQQTLKYSDNVLYAYFKTRVPFHFPALIHGTFELSGDRERIVNTPVNQYLIEQLCQLLIDTALQLSKEEVSWRAIQFLSFDILTENALSEFKFRDKLVGKIKANRLFPSIYNEYHTADNNQLVQYDVPFAEVIDFTRYKICQNLLKYSSDPNVIRIGRMAKTYIYDETSLSKSLSSISPQLSIDERARLILFLNDTSVISANMLPDLLVDHDGQIIKNGSDIFLPPEGNDLIVPDFVELKFVNDALLATLKQQKRVRTNRELLTFLSKFQVSEYNFSNILKKMLAAEKTKREHSKTPTIQFIIPVLRSIFNFWKGQKTMPNLADVKIELPNRTYGFVASQSLHMGTDYESGYLLEQLLAGDDNCFLLGPKHLGIDEDHKESFFEWLGVHKKLVVGRYSITQLFPGFLQQIANSIPYPYTTNLYHLVFGSAKQFHQNVTYGFELECDYCVELGRVLNKAKPEHILAWLIKDGDMNSKISSEFDVQSSFHFGVPSKHYKEQIDRKYIPTYIRFIIGNTSWLPTNQDKIEKPIDCVLLESSNFVANFLPTPRIDYTDEIFTTYGISRERIDQTLKDIGCKNNFSHLEQSQIYKLLNELPTFDPEGRYAKSIYRMVLVDVKPEDLDTQEKNYVSFITHGKIFAKHAGTLSYFPIVSTYYLDNTIFCQAVSDKLCIAEVDRRRGRQKVKSLFGINPIENVKFRLLTEPNFHDLDGPFENDLDSFKIYFYAQRESKDHEKNDLRAIRSLSVKLCTHLKTEYSFDGNQWHGMELGNYEYITTESNLTQMTYIKIPISEEFSSLQNLKEQIKFCEAIVNILSNSIRLEGSEDLNYMYSVPDKSRMDLFRTRFNDDLDLLERSKAAFGAASNSLFRFWSPIAELLNFELIPNNEHDILSAHLNEVLTPAYLNRVFQSISYSSLNSQHNYSIFKELFQKLGITLQDYNQHSKNEIVILPVLKNELIKLHHSLEESFSIGLYELLKQGDLDIQLMFFEMIQNFQFAYDEVDIRNDFNFDLRSAYVDFINQVFSISLDSIVVKETLAEIFQKSLEDVGNTFEASIPSEFLASPRNRALILFRRYDECWEALKEYSKESSPTQVASDPKKSIFDQLQSEISGAQFSPGSSEPEKNGTPPLVTRNRRGNAARRSSGQNVSDVRKAEIGLKGEFAVYQYLLKASWATDIRWLSKNAESYILNLVGDDSLGYDIRFIDSSGRLRYVEVKSTTAANVEFILTRNEYLFALENRGQYLVALVTHVEEKFRRFYFLENLFEEREDFDFFSNDRYDVDSAAYTVTLLGEERYFTDIGQ